MRTKNEIQQLMQEILTLIGFVAMNGPKETLKQFPFACVSIQAFEWVLEEIGTEEFKSDHLDLFKLRIIASNIEYRTGKKMQDFTS